MACGFEGAGGCFELASKPHSVLARSKMTQLYKQRGAWPPREFQSLSVDSRRQFFKSIRDKTGGELTCATNSFLQKYQKTEKLFAEGGQFLPLSVWKTKGFDTDKIRDLSPDEDKDMHNVVGLCYRVAIKRSGFASAEGVTNSSEASASGAKRKADTIMDWLERMATASSGSDGDLTKATGSASSAAGGKAETKPKDEVKEESSDSANSSDSGSDSSSSRGKKKRDKKHKKDKKNKKDKKDNRKKKRKTETPKEKKAREREELAKAKSQEKANAAAKVMAQSILSKVSPQLLSMEQVMSKPGVSEVPGTVLATFQGHLDQLRRLRLQSMAVIENPKKRPADDSTAKDRKAWGSTCLHIIRFDVILYELVLA